MKNWTEILLKPSSILETTIQVLHSGGARIALVVDSNRKLLGTVTDGDIRRALISQVDMDYYSLLSQHYNPYQPGLSKHV